MEALSDEDFDHVRDFDMSDYETETESVDHDTPSTTPPRTQTPRPTDRKIIPCPYESCSKTFNRNARLQEHIRSHTGERPFKCPEPFCSKAFLRDSHLKHHITSAHTDIRKYQCTWEGCAKSFATGTRLRRHIQSHEGKEKYRCRGYDGCNETFRKHETLRKHVVTVHENRKPFPCTHVHPETNEQCEQSFDTTDKLKSHVRSIHDSTKFSCSICLANHMEANLLTGLPDDIEIPRFAYATFLDLQAHIAEIHPPSCQYCPTSFVKNKELTRHLELQHGVIDPTKQEAKRFPCTYAACSHVFTKTGNLNVHIKTVHEKQRDYVCGSTGVPVPIEVKDQSQVFAHGCGRSFTSKASLVEHVRVAHFNLPSKRSQREDDKRAKRAAEDDISIVSARARRPRKDKGLKKSSTLSSLSGLNLLAQTPVPTALYPPLSDLPVQDEVTPHSFGTTTNAEEDDWNQLSGSMTICGDHLYHNGQGYHLTSDDGSADRARLDQVQYMPCHESTVPFGSINDTDTEPFFDFEHEREHIHSNLDPLLMQA